MPPSADSATYGGYFPRSNTQLSFKRMTIPSCPYERSIRVDSPKCPEQGARSDTVPEAMTVTDPTASGDEFVIVPSLQELDFTIIRQQRHPRPAPLVQGERVHHLLLSLYRLDAPSRAQSRTASG